VTELNVDKVKRFDWQDSKVGLAEIVRYFMMIKSEPKNKMEVNAESEYSSVQNIVYHKHAVNAVYGAIFKQLFDRFISLLKPNVQCMLKKNISDINSHLNNYMVTGHAYTTLELDFSLFDKSQLQMCYELEMFMWRKLGMEQYYLTLWRLGHFDTSARDFINGITAMLMFQRRSGDAATCFGNTMISMMTIARSVNLDKLVCANFVGDDSFVALYGKTCKDNIVRTLSEVFNLTAKLIDLHVVYMCSSFIVDTGEGFVMVPDPLKRIERLGKKLHIADESEIFERYQSFKELMVGLEYVGVTEGLVIGITERYGDSAMTTLAMDALRTVAHSFEEFKRLYVRNDATYDKKVKNAVVRQ